MKKMRDTTIILCLVMMPASLCMLGCSTKVVVTSGMHNLAGKNVAVIDTGHSEEKIDSLTLVWNSGSHEMDCTPLIEEHIMENALYDIVDRSEINSILDEKKLSTTDLIQSEQVCEAAKIIGADGIVFVESEQKWWWVMGVVLDYSECKVRIVDVETGKCIATGRSKRTLPCPITGYWYLFDFPGGMAKSIVEEMTKQMKAE